jgi:hypothetical protein
MRALDGAYVDVVHRRTDRARTSDRTRCDLENAVLNNDDLLLEIERLTLRVWISLTKQSKARARIPGRLLTMTSSATSSSSLCQRRLSLSTRRRQSADNVDHMFATWSRLFVMVGLMYKSREVVESSARKK